MWFVTHSRSDIYQPATTKVEAFAVIAVLVVLVHGVAGLGALVTTDRYIVTEDERIGEDQYVTSTSAVIEGTIDGDLTIFSGSVSIVGEVTGNVTAFSSATVRLEPSGSIGGSVRGAGLNLTIEGDVGGDVFFTAGTVVVAGTGSVARDVMAFGGTTRIEGSVGRDVRGRSFRTTISGTVGGDVDIATSSLGIDAQADIGGDVLYRSSSDASIDPGATIVGTVTKLPAQSNFLYGIILSLANVVGFLGFLVAGLVALWLARGVGSRAVGAMLTRPIRSLLAGIAFVIVLPLSIGLLAVTLVGIPLLLLWFPIGLWATGRYLANMSATLTDRRLIVKRGIFTRIEKTVPLDKITDLGMVEGPIMRAFDVQRLTVETAGQSGAGALVALTGVVDAAGFREQTLAARDAMDDRRPAEASRAEPGADADVVALLGEISQTLQRIEGRLGSGDEKPGG